MHQLCVLKETPSGFWCPTCDPDKRHVLRKRAQRHCGPLPEDWLSEDWPPCEVSQDALQAKFDALDTLPGEYAPDVQMAIVEASHSPDLRQRVWHYLDALEKWAKAGCPLRSMESAEKCRQVCLTCPSKKYNIESDSCEVCGCNVGVSRFIPIRSKPRMATETCPKGHWPDP